MMCDKCERVSCSVPETGSVRGELISLASKMLRNRGGYPIHPENQEFRMSNRAWRVMDAQHKEGDEFFRQIGIELSELAKRLPIVTSSSAELYEATSDLMDSFTATGPKFDRVRDALKAISND